MGRLWVLFLLVGCGDLKATKQDSDHIRQSSDQIQQDSAAMRQASERLLEQAKITNQGVHLQTLNNALTGLLGYGSRPPLLAPYAKVFDDEASAAEVLDISRVMLLDARLDLKVQSYIVTATLAGFLGHDKFAALLASQMDQGPYQQTALDVAGLRYWFLKQRLGQQVQDDHFTVGSLGAAAQLLAELKFIATLPYVDQITILIPLPTKIDPKELTALADSIKDAAKPLDQKDPAVQKLLAGL